jgi:inosine/xanthosine triphosphatase
MEKIIVYLGSKNQAKVKTLNDVLVKYDMFKEVEVFGFEVDTGVSEQPLSLEETIIGAKNRALHSFEKVKCKYSFGIESGFMQVIGSNTGYMEFSVCAIYDGEDFYIGFSPCFECPKDIMHYVLHEKMDLAQASTAAGYSDDPKLGEKQGIIGILTKGKIDRTSYTSSAIVMAMVHIDKVKNNVE